MAELKGKRRKWLIVVVIAFLVCINAILYYGTEGDKSTIEKISYEHVLMTDEMKALRSKVKEQQEKLTTATSKINQLNKKLLSASQSIQEDTSTVKDLEETLLVCRSSLMYASQSQEDCSSSFSELWKNGTMKKADQLYASLSKQGQHIEPVSVPMIDWDKNNPGRITNVLAEGRAIKGITALDNRLFVLRFRSPKIEIYDTTEQTFLKNESVDGLASPNDITSCRNFRYIYIADLGDGMEGITSIHRLEVDRRTFLDRHIRWSVESQPHGMSVNPVTFSLLVAFSQIGVLREYTSRGQLLREISLPHGIEHPFHAIRLSTDKFIVSHGRNSDPVSEVCIVNADSEISGQCFGKPHSDEPSEISRSVLRQPFRLASSSVGLHMVADVNNRRIVILGPKLQYVRNLVYDLDGPERLALDEVTGQLYIADNKFENGKYTTGHVKVFRL